MTSEVECSIHSSRALLGRERSAHQAIVHQAAEQAPNSRDRLPRRRDPRDVEDAGRPCVRLRAARGDGIDVVRGVCGEDALVA